VRDYLRRVGFPAHRRDDTAFVVGRLVASTSIGVLVGVTRCLRCQRRLAPTGQCAVHGRPTSLVEVADDTPPPPVKTPAGWTLGHCLATGGTAIVYEVAQGSATAVMKRSRWRGRDITARFELEAEALQAIGAPTTPAYIAHGIEDGFPYLIMEHVAGETLATWMARSGDRGGLGEILAILTRLAKSLAKVHEAGIVHRDLKPENILIGGQGVRLLDFGLAKPLRSSTGLTQIGSVVGTVHYLAPEQLRAGSIVDHRADIYAFGVVAFEMLTGRPLFVGDRRAIEYHHQLCRPPPVSETRDVPAALDEVILQCLAKQAEARPQTAHELRQALNSLPLQGTIRGIGSTQTPEPKQLGKKDRVALAWIEGADPLVVARGVGEVQGIVVRSRGDGILCAFSSLHHDAPHEAALRAVRPLVRDRCRAVIHVSDALVRRAAQGRATVYGADIEQLQRWIPAIPYGGLVVTSAAAALTRTRPAPEVPGFARLLDRDQTDATDARIVPTMVGRDNLVRNLLAAAASPAMLIGICGGEGAGKSRVLDALTEQLRALGRNVIAIRGQRRLLGERPDDDQLVAALGGKGELGAALQQARARDPRLVIVVDDVHCLSAAARRTLVADRSCVRIVASPAPIFEVIDGHADRISIELPPLSYLDADKLLREMLRPAQLLPDILVERLAIRGTGNPGLLVALGRDIKRRGAVRRHAGGDDWYVAADELDTLLAPPSPSWFASRALEEVPLEHATVFRMSSALGVRFHVDEVAVVAEVSDAQARLSFLVMANHLVERDGLYEFVDPSLQEALYLFSLDERSLVHQRALRFWLAQPPTDLIGWLAHVAHHAAGAGEVANAAAAWSALAARGGDQADELRARVVDILMRAAAPPITNAIRKLDRDADLEADARQTQVRPSQPPPLRR
jgi:tRNA A-37 threonylcarbamoyl transferase component Bud32